MLSESGVYVTFSCTDINECTQNNCIDGNCVNSNGTYDCTCNPGFELIAGTCTGWFILHVKDR